MSLSLDIDLSAQKLRLLQAQSTLRQYPISSAKNGPGEQNNSGCTPRGQHRLRAKIGAGLPSHMVFVGRRPSGEIYTEELRARHPQRDWILTRILWLGGQEPGRNRYGSVDTQCRYIYIHGTPEETLLGQPVSHGCIRMANADVIDLFDRIVVGTPVNIHE
jgi:lipoprotein-anchoring transpeptidase ErfK/SrfK